MNPMQMTVDILERARERFYDTLDQMTVDEANTMPHPLIKSVTWLLWHDARVMDLQISELAKTETLWTSQGWKERFNLPLPDNTQDWIHTPEEAALVTIADKEILKGYFDAAYELTCDYLISVEESSLDDVIDRSWDPPVTRRVRLVSTVDDISMHSGQAVYTRRLVINK